MTVVLLCQEIFETANVILHRNEMIVSNVNFEKIGHAFVGIVQCSYPVFVDICTNFDFFFKVKF